MSYKGSGYYKRKKSGVVIAAIIVVLLLIAAAAAYFLTECLVFTADGYKIMLPWKNYNVPLDTEPDDGSEPIFDIPEKPAEPEQEELASQSDITEPDGAETPNADTEAPNETPPESATPVPEESNANTNN